MIEFLSPSFLVDFIPLLSLYYQLGSFPALVFLNTHTLQQLFLVLNFNFLTAS